MDHLPSGPVPRTLGLSGTVQWASASQDKPFLQAMVSKLLQGKCQSWLANASSPLVIITAFIRHKSGLLGTRPVSVLFHCTFAKHAGFQLLQLPQLLPTATIRAVSDRIWRDVHTDIYIRGARLRS